MGVQDPVKYSLKLRLCEEGAIIEAEICIRSVCVFSEVQEFVDDFHWAYVLLALTKYNG